MNKQKQLLISYQCYSYQKASMIFIGIIVLSSILGGFQIYSAMDSIIEIRIAEDFQFKPGIVFDKIGGGNFTFNATTDKWFAPIIQIYLIDTDNPIAPMNDTVRVQFITANGYYRVITEAVLDELFLSASLGTSNAEQSFLTPGAIYKMRVPRGLNFYAVSIAIVNFPNFANRSINFSQQVSEQNFFSEYFFGLPTNSSTLFTDFQKTVLTIHDFSFNYDVQEILDRSEEEAVYINEIPGEFPYSINVTSSKESAWPDILDSSIK